VNCTIKANVETVNGEVQVKELYERMAVTSYGPQNVGGSGVWKGLKITNLFFCLVRTKRCVSSRKLLDQIYFLPSLVCNGYRMQFSMGQSSRSLKLTTHSM